MRNILVTGGLGFIGSHAIKHLLADVSYFVVNLDAQTYAGNPENLAPSETTERYEYVQGDICDRSLVRELFDKYRFHSVLNLAAESHVDRSIESPTKFVETNVLGTACLLDCFKRHWESTSEQGDMCFVQVSTDEVYGSLGESGSFLESTPYSPRSPYAATKASADHLVRSYGHTFGLPTRITNCSNNYGPNQYPEKLIPLVIERIYKGNPIPVYGDGRNIRDWLHVHDHVCALQSVLEHGQNGESYNIGASNEIRNIELVQQLCQISDDILGRPPGTSESLITFVQDRKGHDFRYAVNSDKIRSELGWTPKVSFESGIRETTNWYIERLKVKEEVPTS